MLSQTVVAFDLDDTLYREIDYVQSGYRYLVDWVERLVGTKVPTDFSTNDDDFIGRLCNSAGLPQQAKESLLWLYRLHEPAIALSQDVHELIRTAERVCKMIYIVTDGRSTTQRIKLKALGLAHISSLISGDGYLEKPDDARFRLIMSETPAHRYVYVGDNPAKDFDGPNRLGWTTVGLRYRHDQIHNYQGYDAACEPKYWIDELPDLMDLLDHSAPPI